METLYLTRRNLLTLLSKLDRKKLGDDTKCTIIKSDNIHPNYPNSMERIAVVAVEDDDYYSNRKPGIVHPLDS